MKTKAVKQAEAIARNAKYLDRNKDMLRTKHPEWSAERINEVALHMQGVPKSQRQKVH